jgi:hypothetical protein
MVPGLGVRSCRQPMRAAAALTLFHVPLDPLAPSQFQPPEAPARSRGVFTGSRPGAAGPHPSRGLRAAWRPESLREPCSPQ